MLRPDLPQGSGSRLLLRRLWRTLHLPGPLGLCSCCCHMSAVSHAPPQERGRAVVAGVVSWGLECGRQQWPGVYARVDQVPASTSTTPYYVCRTQA